MMNQIQKIADNNERNYGFMCINTACAARPEAELQKHGIVIGEWRNGSAGVFEALG
jgi:hypothetical protein